MQYYVPIFREVYEKNMFDPFILLLFSNYGIESVEQYAKKQKRDISEVKTTVFSYWDRIIATRMLDYTKRAKAPMLYSYEQANNLYVAGNLAMEEGKVVFKEGKASIYEDGYLAAEGNFNNNGKKEGAWRYYYSTGLPRLTETYKNGVMQGEARQYRSNGFLKEVRKYNSAGEQTETQEYTYNGILSTTTISKGEESEYIVYHPDGKKRKTFKIKNKSLVSGQYRSQYSNGSTEEEMEILDGKRNGVYKEYYENGKLSVLANFRKGDRHGMFTTYYENGNKKSELNYNQGKADGERISYNEKGQITSKTNYSNGELNGVEMQLSGGKEYYSLEYRNGIPLSYTYRGPDGVEVKEASKKLTTLKLYHPNGNLKGNLPLKDGQATGLAKYYFQTGGLREDVNFENDVRHGVCTEYYKNGKPYIVANYIKGERTGWYKEYHTNGKLRAEGWLTDDNKEGQWKFYSVAGKIESEAYYRSGDEYGPVKHYDGNGKAEYMDYYDNGMIMRMEQYDNTGKIILEQSFPLGTGKYRFIYPNGNTSFEAQLKNGFYEGAYTYYYPDKTLKEKGYYKNGKKDSLTINYFPGGQESTRGSFRDGRKNGKWTYYRYDGKLEREIDFVKGEEQGKDKVYQYGELRNEYNMEDNAMEGDQLFYGEDKKLAAVYNYKNYDLAGYTYEGADGKLKPLIPIKNGTVKIASYYPNGKKAIEASIIENMYDGKITTYYSNGNIAEEKTYTSTDLNGAYNRFHPNGNPSYEATYKDDVLNGTEKIYDEQGKPLVQGNYVMGERHGLHIYNDAKTGKNYKLNYDYGRLLTIENK
jgi:antitoxin component YwqK of YwqJK toxin-antitoxin module